MKWDIFSGVCYGIGLYFVYAFLNSTPSLASTAVAAGIAYAFGRNAGRSRR